MAEHIITGCLVKYGVPMFDGLVAESRAFEKIATPIRVPVMPDSVRFKQIGEEKLGKCDLEYRDDGVYFVCYLDNRKESDEIVSELKDGTLFMTLSANRVKRLGNIVTSGVIRHVRFILVKSCADISTIDGVDVNPVRSTKLNVRKIQCELIEHDMTQRDLADLVGITEVSISRYLSQQRMPRAGILQKMAEVLGVEPEELMIREKTENDADRQYNRTLSTIVEYRDLWTQAQKRAMIIELLS